VVCDLSRTATFKFDKTFTQAAAEQLILGTIPVTGGKSTSGTAVFNHYETWRNHLIQKTGIRLDPKRLFDENDKARIYQRDSEICQICREKVEAAEAEYDHYPVPHASGGRTVVENGRLVCRKCHPRGIAAGQLASA